MINPISLIKDIDDASQAGQQLENPQVWASRASGAAIITLLTALIALANQFISVPIDVSPEDIKSVALGIVAFGAWISNRLHVASNIHAGK